jgi:hypothetical protein
MSRKRFFFYPPYRGSEPYLYLCFHRGDSKKVKPLLARLYARGCRVWYSLENPLGQREIRAHDRRINGASFMAVYLTNKVLDDKGLSASIQYFQALDRDAVMLVSESLPPDWELLVTRAFRTGTAEIGEDDTAEVLESALIRSEGFSRSLIGKSFYPTAWFFKRVALTVSSLILVAGLLIFLIRSYCPQPFPLPDATSVPPAAVIADPVVLKAAKDALLIKETDYLAQDALARIKRLQFTETPETLEDLVQFINLERLVIPQECVPLAARLPKDRAYVITVYGEERQ